MFMSDELWDMKNPMLVVRLNMKTPAYPEATAPSYGNCTGAAVEKLKSS